MRPATALATKSLSGPQAQALDLFGHGDAQRHGAVDGTDDGASVQFLALVEAVVEGVGHGLLDLASGEALAELH